MASYRKTPKGTSSGRPRSYSELYRNSREGASSPQPINSSKQPTASASPLHTEAVDLKSEYRYVMEDIRRLGLITGVLIAVMVAASFFI